MFQIRPSRSSRSYLDTVLTTLHSGSCSPHPGTVSRHDLLDSADLCTPDGLTTLTIYLCCVVTGKLVNTKISSSTPTIVTEQRWADVFNAAHVPASLTPCDMDSYMRAHVAAATPLLTLCSISHKRGAGLTWAEARTHAKVATPSRSL